MYKTKDRPEAVFVALIGAGSGCVKRDCLLATAVSHEADTSEAQEHHGPSGGFCDR